MKLPNNKGVLNMINVCENGYYTTIGTNKGVYLIAFNKVLAYKPSPKRYDYYSIHIDKGVYDTLTNGSNELLNKIISKFCGRTVSEIITKANNGEFTTSYLQELF